ncbi:MAG: T9SS type A sorting domain-containing protein [Ignavibacteriales bacterium]|nr:T9SS type A sorting domain-containing protein [Ignavibacteriales bacterium]
MGRIFSLIFIICALSTAHFAQVLFVENFDYTTGTLLTANGYLGHSAAGTNAQTVVSGSLTYPGYTASGIGNSLKLVNSGEDCSKRFIATDSITTGSVYFACLVKVDSARTGDYFIHVANASLQGTTYSARVMVRKANNGNLTFGIGKISNTANSPRYTDSIYTFGTTYLVVARYKFIEGALNDEVSLWVNPALTGPEPAPNVVLTDALLADVTSLSTIAYRQGSSASASFLTIDGITVSRSWIGGTAPIVSWESVITVSDNGNAHDFLTYGTAAAATDGIDPALGEATLPPPPPTGIFDCRFELPVTPAEFSLKDYRRDTLQNIAWTVKFQTGSGGYPITLTWNPIALPEGSFTLKDLITGTIVNVNMKSVGQAVISNTGISSLGIIYTNNICKQVNIAAGWNIVSVPVIANDMTVAGVFSGANSPAYGFSNGYQTVSTVTTGKGYWIRYPQAAQLNICGNFAGFNIPLNAGWNLIGIHHIDLPTEALSTEPPGIINSPFYAYNNAYTTATMLLSGKGYWVRTSQAGIMEVPVPVNAKVKMNLVPIIQKEWNKVVISDNSGNKGSLYLGNTNADSYELPPVPPVGIFDVRFSDQSFVRSTIGTSEIIITAATYPVTIQSAASALKITDAATGGKLLNSIIKPGKPAVVTNSAITAIQVETVELPQNFSLEQNYPNPFNPTTTINFHLPEKYVTSLRIYNQLGELVVTLLNSELEAGSHSFTWNAAGNPSGIYFYELKAGKNSSVKKLLLMK